MPTWGVTAGLAELLAAREVWVLATGAHKAEIVRRALTEPVSLELPVSWIVRHRNAVLWLDEEAASLGGPGRP